MNQHFLLVHLALLAAGSAFSQTPAQTWFRDAKLGFAPSQMEDAAGWIPALQAAGVKYVAISHPDAATAELASKHGITLVDGSSYPNLGQFIPPEPTRVSTRWECRFAIAGRTSGDLIRLFVEVVSKGGNLMLIPSSDMVADLRILAELGKWLRTHGEAIYAAEPGPLDRMPFFGRTTVKGNDLFVFLFGLPADRKLDLGWLESRVVSASLLGGSPELRMLAPRLVELPTAKPGSPAVSVVKLRLADGPVRVKPFIAQPDASGLLTAGAESAEFLAKPGLVARREESGGRVRISHWTRAIDVPSWRVSIPRDGRYAVEMIYSAGSRSAGVLYTVTMRGATMGMAKGVVASTNGESRRIGVSNMELEAGKYMLVVQPENNAGQPAMELEAVLLHRIGD